MKRLLVLCVGSCFMLGMMLGCSNKSPPSPVSVNPAGATGVAAITINLGAVGLAKEAKAATINLVGMNIDLSAIGEQTIHRTYPLSGNGQQTVSQTFALDPRQWTITVSTYDWYTQIHRGSMNFNVTAGDTAKVNMSLSAQYSMLYVWINQIPDSSSEIALYDASSYNNALNGGNKLCDTSFPAGSSKATDTVKLHYDYLLVANGAHPYQAIIFGTYAGVANQPLYWGTLNLPNLVSGQDTSYSFNLNWIGPADAQVNKTIIITVGRIGLITVGGTPIAKPN